MKTTLKKLNVAALFILFTSVLALGTENAKDKTKDNATTGQTQVEENKPKAGVSNTSDFFEQVNFMGSFSPTKAMPTNNWTALDQNNHTIDCETPTFITNSIGSWPKGADAIEIVGLQNRVCTSE